MRNYHRLRDNDSITSRDPVDPAAERAESVHSARTDPEFMVRRFMKDIEGQPDGDEDHTMCEEDYTGHLGDGEFKDVDVERESLQGFGDAEEMAELESRSSSVNSSSLEDQQKVKTLLSNIQKENQAYQASKQQEVTVELNPLRSHPSLTSPSSTNANGGVPLSNGQRIAPDGYVEDLNISVGSEGFHNPTCPPSVLEGVAVNGGLVPPTTSTLTNLIAVHSSHVTSHMNGAHLQPNRQQHGSRTSTPGQSSRDGNQMGMNRTVSSAAAPSDGGYLQSSQLPGIQVIPRQPLVGGNSSFNLINLSSNNENSIQSSNLQSSLGGHNISANGYVQESASMTNGGIKSTLNLNRQPPLGTSTHILSSDGYFQDPTSLSVGGDKREGRGPSTESGNEEDSLSNEGDSNSVFDDDLIPSENPAHSMRPRSTVTSGFQSGSSESASSPEPPQKSHSSSSISPTPVVESTFTSTDPTYRPSSTGGSSGYVTNESSQSYTYHTSSATSQTSQTSGLASSELDQELNLKDVQKYTIPSLLVCGSKSSSPAISRAAGSDWTANDTSAMQTDFVNTRYYSHSHHLQTASATVADYVNTSDVDPSKVSTDLLEALSQSSDRASTSTGDHGVSFEFPTSAS